MAKTKTKSSYYFFNLKSEQETRVVHLKEHDYNRFVVIKCYIIMKLQNHTYILKEFSTFFMKIFFCTFSYGGKIYYLNSNIC